MGHGKFIGIWNYRYIGYRYIEVWLYNPPTREILAGQMLERELAQVNSKIDAELNKEENLTLGLFNCMCYCYLFYINSLCFLFISSSLWWLDITYTSIHMELCHNNSIEKGILIPIIRFIRIFTHCRIFIKRDWESHC